jgi:hypothetical protein
MNGLGHTLISHTDGLAMLSTAASDHAPLYAKLPARVPWTEDISIDQVRLSSDVSELNFAFPHRRANLVCTH